MGPKWTVLLIDDDEDDCLLVKQAFQQECADCTIRCVHNGQDLRNYRSGGGKPPTLILLDIGLPIESGREILQELKADPDWRLIPVVMYTGNQDEQEVIDCYKAGASAFLIKPTEVTAIRQFAYAIRLFWFESVVLPTVAR